METDGRIRSKDIGTGEVNSRVIDDLRSSNYDGSRIDPENDPGLNGWQILKSGFVVINDAIVRGTISAARIISAVIESGVVRLSSGGKIELGGDPETGTPATATLSETGIVVGPTSLTASGVTVGSDVVMDATGLHVEGGLVSAFHMDVAEQKGTANQSLSSTPLEYATHTFTLPAWVQQVKVMCWAYGQMTNSSGGNQTIIVRARVNDVDDGGVIQTIANGTSGSVMHVEESVVNSPGGSVDISVYMAVGAGTNSSNQGAVWGFVVGLRT